MKILAANAFAICALASSVWFVSVGHVGFAVASMFLAALTSHTYSEKEK